ncbi:MAG TPA: protein kinase [Kofleriaceae bacterium]|jgi:serine/threonine-protein kinase|nr:protein kinase [Kofleriaceae bacterium]
MARESSVRFAAGARLGDYRIDRELAFEETCVVYQATHVVLPRQALLKITHPGSHSAAVQLLREACILEALSHAGIPRVHECGVLPDRRPWSAIERMPGATVKQLAGDGPLALADLVVMLRDVADILQHAHERGVVHRRLTAGAIARTQRRSSGHAICDWGDARTLDTESDVAVDPRDDVHALGAIVFRALTGRPPAPARSAAAHSPSAPTELAALVDQMVAEPVVRPLASEVYDRALWLCDTLESSPLIERPRWTPPQGIVPKGASAPAGPAAEGHRSGFSIRISRTRTT